MTILLALPWRSRVLRLHEAGASGRSPFGHWRPKANRDTLKKNIMLPTKACPIVLRDSGATQILVFRHPSAGIQLVKGSIEVGEQPADAALRELREESGIVDAVICQDLGIWDARYGGQIWSLQLCTVSKALSDSWHHHCGDDGGLDLYFFWHDLDAEPSENWHPLFQRALQFIRWRIKT